MAVLKPTRRAWVLIVLAVVVVAVVIIGYRQFLNNPKAAVIPPDTSKWQTELAPSISRLSDNDKRLVAAFLARTKIAEILGGKASVPDGLTVGRAIEEEQEWEQGQAAKDAEAKALETKIKAGKDATARQINEMLIVALVAKGFQPADWQAGNVSDVITIELALENKGKTDIAGVKGTTVFQDMFGDVIKQINLSYDGGIPAGKSVTWTGTLRYNQFDTNDAKLRSVDMSKLKFSFIPSVVVFSDGTKLEAPSVVTP